MLLSLCLSKMFFSAILSPRRLGEPLSSGRSVFEVTQGLVAMYVWPYAHDASHFGWWSLARPIAPCVPDEIIAAHTKGFHIIRVYYYLHYLVQDYQLRRHCPVREERQLRASIFIKSRIWNMCCVNRFFSAFWACYYTCLWVFEYYSTCLFLFWKSPKN